MGLRFNGIKPPRHFVPPLLSLRAGGEILGVLRFAATKALTKLQNENENGNENEFSLVSSFLHPLIPYFVL